MEILSRDQEKTQFLGLSDVYKLCRASGFPLRDHRAIDYKPALKVLLKSKVHQALSLLLNTQICVFSFIILLQLQ